VRFYLKESNKGKTSLMQKPYKKDYMRIMLCSTNSYWCIRKLYHDMLQTEGLLKPKQNSFAKKKVIKWEANRGERKRPFQLMFCFINEYVILCFNIISLNECSHQS
jgi:hypothetical protein